MSSARPSHRINELDALRGLAALAVVLYHYTVQPALAAADRTATAFSFTYGDQGVPLFFMISGYVIFMTLDPVTTVADFTVGRFSRLFPAFWACLLLTHLVVALAGLPGQAVSPIAALWNITMMPRLLAHAPMVDGAYWSLECELLFYAAMVLLFRLGALRRIVPVMFVWLAAAIAAQLILRHADTTTALYHFTGKLQTVTSLNYIHLFSTGMVLYDVKRLQRWTAGHVSILAVCAAITLWTSAVPLPALLIIGLGLLFHAATSARLPFLNWRPLVWLGGISYPLYLLHQNIGIIGLKALDARHSPPLLALLITTVGALVLACLVSILVERPAMRWIRSQYRKQPQATTALSPQPERAV